MIHITSKKMFNDELRLYLDRENMVMNTKFSIHSFLKRSLAKPFLDEWVTRIESLKDIYFECDSSRYEDLSVEYDILSINERITKSDIVVSIKFCLKEWDSTELYETVKSFVRTVPLDTLVNYHPKSFSLFWDEECTKLRKTFQTELSKFFKVNLVLLDDEMVEWVTKEIRGMNE